MMNLHLSLYLKTLCGGFTGRGVKRYNTVRHAWSCALWSICGFLAAQSCHSDWACIYPLGKLEIIIHRLP